MRYERRQLRTSPAESTEERTPLSEKPSQRSVAPSESGTGAAAMRTGREVSRRSYSESCMLWSVEPAARPKCVTTAHTPPCAASATSGPAMQMVERCAPVCERMRR
jgi:hypothetical protein